MQENGIIPKWKKKFIKIKNMKSKVGHSYKINIKYKIINKTNLYLYHD